MPIVG